jgi:hypothetical protein
MFAFCESRVLMSAVELDVFTVLEDGSLELPELVKVLGIDPRHARDFFDALVSLELLERQDGKYSNTPATAEYLVRTKPETYAGGRVEHFRVMSRPRTTSADVCGSATANAPRPSLDVRTRGVT